MRLAVVVTAAVLSTSCAPAEPDATEAPVAAPAPAAEAPPRAVEPTLPTVVTGTDTLVIRRPTLVAYFGVDPGDAGPAPSRMAAVESFQATLSEVAPVLRNAGVAIVLVDELPRVEGASQASGSRLRPGSTGWVLVDRFEGSRTLDGNTGATELLCTAAYLFGLELPGISDRCPPVG